MILNVKCRKCGKVFAMEISSSEYGDSLLRDARINFAVCNDCAAAETAEQQSETRRQAAAVQYERLLIESRLEKYHLDFDPKHPKANLELFEWVGARVNGNIFLSGSTGIGKTRILQHYAYQRLKLGYSVFFSPSADLLDEIVDAFRKDSKGLALMKKLRQFDLLILDDLGKEATTPAKLQRLWQLIDRRYTRTDQERNIASGQWNPLYAQKDRLDGWQIWVSTNFDAKEIAAMFDQGENKKRGVPTVRRIVDSCEIPNTAGGELYE